MPIRIVVYQAPPSGDVGLDRWHRDLVGRVGTGLDFPPTSAAVGDILYASAVDTLSLLNIGATNTLLGVAGGIPAWLSNIDVQGTLDVTGAAVFDSTVTIKGDTVVGTGLTAVLSRDLYVANDGVSTFAEVRAFGTGFEGSFIVSSTRGTSATPTATQSGDVLGNYYFQGWDTARTFGARIYGVASAEWGTGGDASDAPTDLYFATVPNGSQTLADWLIIRSTGAVDVLGTPFTLTAATTVLSMSSATGTKTISTGGTTNLSLAPGGLVAVTGALTLSTTLGMVSGQKLYVDGVAMTGDTYLYESAANVFDFFAGGVKSLSLIATAAIFGIPARLKGYTVATLPAGTQGDTAFVTDALGPAFLVAVVGGGAVVTTVFYNGAAWVAQ